MIDRSEIDELSTQPRLSAAEIENWLKDLRIRGASLLECMIFVKKNQECSLAEAKMLVIHSHAWSDRKEDFLQQQEEALNDFLAANMDNIASIHQEISPDGTKTVVHMKR